MSTRAFPRPRIDGIAWCLLLAFPLFLVSVRHWASGIYIVLGLLALFAVRRGWAASKREERVYIGIILFYLASTIVSNTANDWTPASIRWYQADMRLWFGIPLLLFLCPYPAAIAGLLKGIPLAGMITGTLALYVTFFGPGRVDGPYGPIFFGNIAALIAIWSLASLRLDTYPGRARIPIHLTGAGMAILAVVLSGTRSAWITLVVAIPLIFLFELRGMHRERFRLVLGFLGVSVALVVFAVAQAPDLTAGRLSQALNEIASYRQAENQEQRNSVASTSVGFRLEQWRIGWTVFQERPLLGFGVGNVGKEINRHVQAERMNPVLYSEPAQRGHPTHLHSAYADALTHKGIVGFLALLAVLGYPAFLALRSRKQAPNVHILVLVNAVAFAVFSLTEDPFIRNNFMSVYLIFTLSSLVLLFRESRKTDNRNERPARAP